MPFVFLCNWSTGNDSLEELRVQSFAAAEEEVGVRHMHLGCSRAAGMLGNAVRSRDARSVQTTYVVEEEDFRSQRGPCDLLVSCSTIL